MDDKLIRITISFSKRMRNKYGEGYVPCEVSDRWLQFPEKSELVGDKNLMVVDVMTLELRWKTKKIMYPMHIKRWYNSCS